MTKTYKVLLGVLILHISVSAAPSDVGKLDDKQKVENADEKLENEAISLLGEAETDGSQNQRQKRWNSNFGFQPYSTGYFSSFGKRVNTFNTGFDIDDPFVEIHRRLQDISNIVKQPAPPPQFPSFSTSQFPSANQLPTSNQFPTLNQFPFYLPVFYIPPEGCNCPTNTPTEQITPPMPKNEGTAEQNKTDTENNMTPATPSRFPDVNNVNQNDIPVDNETEEEEEEGEDVGRPISFDPIIPKRPMSRPPPPVEHGSVQGSVNTGTSAPEAAGAAQDSTTTNPSFSNPTTSSPLATDPPNACDSAVLSCCHQLQVTYDCFASQGCPDPASLGNPCESSVILRVIDRFQRFYGQRTG